MTPTSFPFPLGRMISHSKSAYCTDHPDNVVIFNANVCISSLGKIWHGDLDVTKDLSHLIEFSNATGEPLFILNEMDARFENEKSPKYDRAVCVINSQGIVRRIMK